ncbi:MAG: DedA family protein [Crocinitomicaceae bacterium]|nr:DedA family protein [Crocinitomicaceae bacterium]
MMEFEIGYLGLLITSFLAATFLPITSEVFLVSMLVLGYDPWITLFYATIGNVGGGWFNFVIGRLGKPQWLERLKVPKNKILRWKDKVQRYGHWLGLLSWLPFIGDIMSVALGFFRAPWISSFSFILIGKFLRYLVIVALFVLGWL